MSLIENYLICLGFQGVSSLAIIFPGKLPLAFRLKTIINYDAKKMVFYSIQCSLSQIIHIQWMFE